MGKVSTSPRYVIDITGTDPLSLGKWGGGLILKNSKKMRYFSFTNWLLDLNEIWYVDGYRVSELLL